MRKHLSSGGPLGCAAACGAGGPFGGAGGSQSEMSASGAILRCQPIDGSRRALLVELSSNCPA